MNILGLTLARGGSKGIPKKNIKQINGKPLIAPTIDAALNSNIFNDYIFLEGAQDFLSTHCTGF